MAVLDSTGTPSWRSFIKAQHAAGKRYEWNVTEPDVHVSGDTAWIAYVNKGSITDASGTTKQNWLESAFLEKQAVLRRRLKKTPVSEIKTNVQGSLRPEPQGILSTKDSPTVDQS